MSTDFKIEVFGYLIFYKALNEMGITETELNIFDYYKDEFMKDQSYTEAFNPTFLEGICCRRALFQKIYLEELNFEKAINWRSLSDCYDHVTRVCDRDDLFGHLTIFERLLATCAYVLDLCLRIYSHSLINVVNYGHIIWAMYFDKFSEQFYDEGGWKELKREVSGYGLLLEILIFLGFHINTASCLHVVKEASINYCQFRNVVKYENCKNKQKGRIHISKLWIKFHIKHFEEYVRIPLNYGDSADCIEIELLMQHLKLICNFLGSDCIDSEILQDVFQGKFYSARMLFSKTSVNRGVIKNCNDHLLENLKISVIAGEEFPDTRKCLGTQLQSECTAQSEKIVVSEIIEDAENMKINCIEMEISGNKNAGNIDRNSTKGCNIIPDGIESSRFYTNKKSSDKIADLDINYETANICLDIENQIDSEEDAGHASFSNKNDEVQWNKNSPPKNLPNPINLYSESEISKSYNERESSKSPLKSRSYVKNERCNDNTDQSSAFSSDQMAVSQCERNEVPNKMSTPNDFPGVKEVTHHSDGKINTNRELDNLREEQADPNIINFLRMILILGDKQENHYFRDTLCSSEEGPDISQVKSKKGNKRSKKKPRK